MIDIKETLYRSRPLTNMDYDMVKVEFTLTRNDWRRLKRRIKQMENQHRSIEPEQQKED